MNTLALQPSYEVRSYTSEDYKTISSWWVAAKEMGPAEYMLPEESTFMLTIDNEPVACVSLFLMNTPVAWIENLIGNPSFKGEVRKKGIALLIGKLESFAHDLGYSGLFCMSMNPKTTQRYEELGYKATCHNLTSLVKQIKEIK